MKYDFDEIIDRRGTDSIKWDKKLLKNRFSDEECIPMWVADMDFIAAKPIRDAIVERAQHGIFGYGHKSDKFLEAAVNWQKRRNGWDIEKEWILFTPGIIPALSFIVETFCSRGDNVIIQSPVYYPFAKIINNNGCHVVNNPLIFKNGKYEMNFSELEELAQRSRTRLMILCSPHNPVGRVWTEDELKRLGEICIRNNVLVVTDEIHSDIIYKLSRHIPFGKISEEFKMNSIICTSPSKTFNLAGLQLSNIIIPNIRIRQQLNNKLRTIDIDPNSFASVAQIAAYNQGEEWLEQLLVYLQNNLDFIDKFVKERLQRVRLIKPEATYLAWLDFSDYGLTDNELRELMQKKAKVAMDDGYIFGSGGEKHQRINFACPRSILEKALESIEKSLKGIK
ncbi:MAG: pyridoxal phosphate-dependent aminotransferase [Eubacteriales bacterium]|nr:pyridoxal phosphate-dependent aminotransferase [Eubacteriales bacterium]MDD3200059.1 pyridoxal phosphate-dependent aminotransferase [Eubacteriales bacterium]MDD4122486.1 pyridoxal phosphate-dependent aminotransferase [Eubacteriales bacterium]MDD4629329.1 pyridoxal phosphate-dependent aminotransferase [Eubacteriales bacterium]